MVKGVQVVEIIITVFYLFLILYRIYLYDLKRYIIALNRYRTTKSVASGTPSKVVPVFCFHSGPQAAAAIQGSVHVLFSSQYLNV